MLLLLSLSVLKSLEQSLKDEERVLDKARQKLLYDLGTVSEVIV